MKALKAAVVIFGCLWAASKVEKVLRHHDPPSATSIAIDCRDLGDALIHQDTNTVIDVDIYVALDGLEVKTLAEAQKICGLEKMDVPLQWRPEMLKYGMPKRY